MWCIYLERSLGQKKIILTKLILMENCSPCFWIPIQLICWMPQINVKEQSHEALGLLGFDLDAGEGYYV